MKKVLLGLSTVMLVGFFSSVACAQFSAEPDDYAEGTDISNAYFGVTLSSVGSGWGGVTGPEVYAINPSTKSPPHTASTGSLVFGHSGDFPHLWREPGFMELRADFVYPAFSVSVDFIGDNSSDFGVLKAYDSGDVLIDSAITSQLTYDEVETLTVIGPGIAYILASGDSGASALGIDNMEFEFGTEVAIDIKFCSNPNAFNCKKGGVLPVTIFGMEDFDVGQIDISTLQLCTADLSACTGAPRDYSIADRGDPLLDLGAAMCAIDSDTGMELDWTDNQDGYLDLDAAFEASDVKDVLGDFCDDAAKGDVSGALVIIGETSDGEFIYSAPQDDNAGIDRLVKANK